MATKKPSKQDQLEALDRRLRSSEIIEQVGQTFRFFILAAAAVCIAWIGRLIVADLAGKATEANIVMNLLGTLEVSVTLAWVVGAGGGLYGIAQSRLRKSTVRRLHRRIEYLEKIIDPNRTTSYLGPDGDTNPKDR